MDLILCQLQKFCKRHFTIQNFRLLLPKIKLPLNVNLSFNIGPEYFLFSIWLHKKINLKFSRWNLKSTCNISHSHHVRTEWNWNTHWKVNVIAQTQVKLIITPLSRTVLHTLEDIVHNYLTSYDNTYNALDHEQEIFFLLSRLKNHSRKQA